MGFASIMRINDFCGSLGKACEALGQTIDPQAMERECVDRLSRQPPDSIPYQWFANGASYSLNRLPNDMVMVSSGYYGPDRPQFYNQQLCNKFNPPPPPLPTGEPSNAPEGERAYTPSQMEFTPAEIPISFQLEGEELPSEADQDKEYYRRIRDTSSPWPQDGSDWGETVVIATAAALAAAGAATSKYAPSYTKLAGVVPTLAAAALLSSSDAMASDGHEIQKESIIGTLWNNIVCGFLLGCGESR